MPTLKAIPLGGLGEIGLNMMNMQTVSCSSFTKGETVQISAVKNSSGELVATEIQEAFF
ncbi:MAG: hypothetical protein M1412_01255 [Deltaproteobacteria bacterium]|nr:hypothetical protein [Deltaproteobacteria bacterium]MCL5891782.1 hypothetical protein [Deltaproteobacteria bacterium]